MRIKYLCPQCASEDIRYNESVDYVMCTNCEGTFNLEDLNAQPTEVPVKFHQGINVKHLKEKALYAKGQYDF